MELNRIENLLEKYFNSETDLEEEKELKAYFAGESIAPHLEKYKHLFDYYIHDAAQQLDKVFHLSEKRNYRAWLSIAAGVAVMLGVFTFVYNQPEDADLGTYNDPQVAFRETQKALSLLSGKVNTGVKSVRYIDEYEKSKDAVFK